MYSYFILGEVIVQNPGFAQVQVPAPIPNCPPGLEYLAQIDQMIIKQKKELFESKITFNKS